MNGLAVAYIGGALSIRKSTGWGNPTTTIVDSVAVSALSASVWYRLEASVQTNTDGTATVLWQTAEACVRLLERLAGLAEEVDDPLGGERTVPLDQFVRERHRRAGPPAVGQAPLASGGFGGLDHRQDGRDADAPGDEQVPLAVDERKMIAWPPDLEALSRLDAMRSG